MKEKFIIEQFDNGISIKATNDEGTERRVALDHNKDSEIGKTIWETVKFLMDKHLTSKVMMTIDYKEIIEVDEEIEWPSEQE